jgi:uncharacterized damage-inducible protein DinB
VITPEYCLLMARYNRWMNSRLCALCANLPDDERKRDRGAFFGSIHATLNHLLWGDRSWLGRFIGEPYRYAAFGADMYDDFAQLAEERELTDGKILTWAQSIAPEWLVGSLRYTSSVDGKTRELTRAVAVVHLFNHGTHHRGQVTTLLSQLGHNPGETDLPWVPGVVRIVESPAT